MNKQSRWVRVMPNKIVRSRDTVPWSSSPKKFKSGTITASHADHDICALFANLICSFFSLHGEIIQ